MLFKPDPKEYSKYFFIVFFVILAYLTYLMIGPFLSAIITSLILAYAFFPVYRRLLKVVRNKHVSASLMTLGVLLVILVPVVLIINLLIKESLALYDRLDINQVADLIAGLFQGRFEGYIGPVLEKAVSYIVNVSSSIIFSLPQRILALFVLLFVLFFAFRDSKIVLSSINRIIPVSEAHKITIAEKFKETMDAVIYGTITVAVIQGIFGMVGFYIFGISSPVLWGIILGIVAMLPFVGPATVWIPVVIYHYINGHEAGAIGLAVYSVVILSLILDMIVKPKLISRKGKLHPIGALLGVMGGISVFGITGLILGPFVLSLFIFFVRILMERK